MTIENKSILSNNLADFVNQIYYATRNGWIYNMDNNPARMFGFNYEAHFTRSKYYKEEGDVVLTREEVMTKARETLTANRAKAKELGISYKEYKEKYLQGVAEDGETEE